MNASMCVVIVDGEYNLSLTWNGTYPDVLLTDELTNSTTADDSIGKCNSFGRMASIGIVECMCMYVVNSF